MGPDAEVLSLASVHWRGGGPDSAGCADQGRQNFRQSVPSGQALEMGSRNIAAANVDLQGLGRDRRSGQIEVPSPERR